MGSIEESPEQEIEEEKDWLRVLALRGSTTQCLSARNTVMMGKLSTSSATSSTTSPLLLETVREESPASAIKLLSIECESTVTTTSPDDVSPDGLLVRRRVSPFSFVISLSCQLNIFSLCATTGFSRGESDADA